MKKLLLAALLLITFSANAQLGVGTATPNASAQLDVTSTTKGFLLPRMTQAQRTAISSPVEGLLVYQTDLLKGYYYYNLLVGWALLPGSSQPHVMVFNFSGGFITPFTITSSTVFKITVTGGGGGGDFVGHNTSGGAGGSTIWWGSGLNPNTFYGCNVGAGGNGGTAGGNSNIIIGGINLIGGGGGGGGFLSPFSSGAGGTASGGQITLNGGSGTGGGGGGTQSGSGGASFWGGGSASVNGATAGAIGSGGGYGFNGVSGIIVIEWTE